MDGSYRVFRVEHNNAVVEWYVIDDGKQISAMTWKKSATSSNRRGRIDIHS